MKLMRFSLNLLIMMVGLICAGCSGDYQTAENQAIPTDGARKNGPAESLKDVNIDNEAEYLKNQQKKGK
jgi:hypothetical protein